MNTPKRGGGCIFFAHGCVFFAHGAFFLHTSVTLTNKIKFQTLNKVEEIRKSTNEIQLDEHLYNIIDEHQIKGTVIMASDMVLATLMNFSKSVYSWDIEVHKSENFIFLDKREKGDHEDFVSVDLETIAENSTTPPPAQPEDKAKSKQSYTLFNNS